jgi:hypothetical protein
MLTFIQQEKTPGHVELISDEWFISLTKKMQTVEAGIDV